MTKLSVSILCLAALVTIPGCGGSPPPTVAASGTVLMDGKALDGAGVTLISENGTVALGQTDANGKFSLMTTIGEEVFPGAVAGSHRVAVSKSSNDGEASPQKTYTDPKEMAVKMGGGLTTTVKTTYVVAKRFNSPETSGLRCDVPATGTDALEIKVSGK